jgi:hypothetical protein
MADKRKFIDTFSDDILSVEEAYKLLLKEHPESDFLIWQSLCRVYTLVAVSCVDFYVEYVLEAAGLKKFNSSKENIELIVKTALKLSVVPNALDIPQKIRKYVCLRELRHYIAHTSEQDGREEKIHSISLNLDVEHFSEREFNIIKNIVGDIINLIGMSKCVIDNPDLRLS